MAQGEGNVSGEPVLELGRDEDVSVGTQLGWRLRALILSGRLAAGARLPGVRELASGAGVNVNTARSIYQRLEADGLAVSKHGLGTFVADDPPARPAIEQIAADAVDAARESGIHPRELAQTIYAGSGAGPGDLLPGSDPGLADPSAPPTEQDALAARRSLRDQIARLEAQLAAYVEHLGLEERPPPVTAPAGRVADVGELESVRDGLIDRLHEARAEAEEAGRRQGSARRHLEEMVADPAANRWSVVSNAEMGKPGCTTYEVRPAWGPIGALMSWWRIRVSGGCPLAGPPPGGTSRA